MLSDFQCLSCGQWGSNSIRVKDATTASGYRNLCRPCRAVRHKAERLNAAERLVLRGGPAQEGVKTCTKCGAVKPLVDFPPHCQARDGRNSWCGPCSTVSSNAYVKARRATDPAFREALAELKRAARRARRLGRLAPWCTIGDTLQFYERAADLEKITGVEWNVDHRVPLRAVLASGLHCPANLQAVPRAVNV